jgi:transglutaminase-like putative cysteine protease
VLALRVVRGIVFLLPALALLLATFPAGQGSVTVTANVTYVLVGRFLLVNNANSTVRDFVYVPLPQNTTFQRSFVVSMDPPPLRYAVDEDGNAYAIVLVEADPGSRVWLKVEYRISVAGYRLESAPRAWPPLDVVKKYTSSSGYWNVYNETLIDLAYRVAYADAPYDAARKLAEWVVGKVKYRVQFSRLGSDHAVVRRLLDYAIVGDCVEVADVYVTMARALGLPARTAYGLLLSDREGRMWLNMSTAAEEGDRLIEHWGGHIWPQVYFVEVGWVDVDMLDGMQANVGVYSERHIVFGFEETKYFGSALSSVCVPSYLTLQYAEYEYRGGSP